MNAIRPSCAFLTDTHADREMMAAFPLALLLPLLLAPAVNAFLTPRAAAAARQPHHHQQPTQPSSSSAPSFTALHSAAAGNRGGAPPIPPPIGRVTSSLWDPVLYQGPKAAGGKVKDVEAAAVLEEYHLILEVGESVAVPGERGLFIRTTGSDIEEVTVPWGSLLCGYGEGSIQPSPGSGDKSVLFSMSSPDMAVFFNRELVPLVEVLSESCPDGTGVLGHELDTDPKGRVNITPRQDGEKYYFVPREGIPDKMAFIGLFCNDLAISGPTLPNSKEEYEESSLSNNIGGLVWRVEYDADKKMIVPSRPVVTFLRTLSFRNSEPMEVGLRYGYDTFWGSAQQQQGGGKE